MNIGENLVGSALQSLGYFTIQGLKAGVREADFLAVKVNNKELEFWHIEVQISRNPVGVLRPHAKFGTTEGNCKVPISSDTHYTSSFDLS